LLPPGEKPAAQAYLKKYVWLAKRRLPQFARGTTAWWLEERAFFGGLRLAGHGPVPAIYGPSGDVTWDQADPTYSLEAAKRG
jgi:hypothetical protein